MNLANQLSLFRLVITPIVVVLLQLPASLPAAAPLRAPFLLIVGALYALSVLSDVLDGYIARRYKLASNLGVFLDLTADKILVAAMLVTLVGLGALPAWVVIVILAREFLVSGMRSFAAASGKVVPAAFWGKAKTSVTNLALLAYCLTGVWPQVRIEFLVLMYLATAFTVFSGLDYMVRGRVLFGGSPKPQAPATESLPSARQ